MAFFHTICLDLWLATFKRSLTVCVSEGISTQSLREPVNLAQSQDTGLQASSAPAHNSQRHTASSGIHSQGETKHELYSGAGYKTPFALLSCVGLCFSDSAVSLLDCNNRLLGKDIHIYTLCVFDWLCLSLWLALTLTNHLILSLIKQWTLANQRDTAWVHLEFFQSVGGRNNGPLEWWLSPSCWL